MPSSSTSRSFESHEGNSSRSTELNRPRRPNPDTITYLKSLPLDVEIARQEISTFLKATIDGGDDGTRVVEFPSVLAAALSALDEIRMEVASLAGDESGAEVLELLIKITAPCSVTASLAWLESLKGYTHHLALHRYGSHVLQTILEQVFIAKTMTTDNGTSQQDLARHADSPMETSTTPACTNVDLCKVLEELQQELLPVFSELTTQLCATHVVRTLFLIFGGIEYVTADNQQQKQPHRGKSKKKKPQQQQDNEKGALPYCQIQYISNNNRRLACLDSMNQYLDEWTDAIAPPAVVVDTKPQQQQPGELQMLACHASGGPLLMVLLRSLTYRDAASHSAEETDSSAVIVDPSFKSLGKLPIEPRFQKGSKACALAERILCWSDGDGYVGDGDNEDHSNKVVGDVIYGLAGETRGSHVLDTILRLCHDDMHVQILQWGQFAKATALQEYVEHTVSNFVVQTLLATIRTSDAAHQMFEACIPLISTGLIIDANKRRRGILWRLSELAVRYPSEQACLLQALKNHCSSSSSSLNQLPSLMLDPKRSSERIMLNVEGSRALYHFLQFQCPGADDVLAGVLALSVDDLEALARDGLGSRVVWDPLLQQQHSGGAGGGRRNNSSLFSKTGTKLLHKLKGHWCGLATDRVGHHVVLNLFRTLPKDESRELLVQELMEARHRLQGNAMGRTISTECGIDIYKNQGPEEWKKNIQKRLGQRKWLDGLDSSQSAAQQQRHPQQEEEMGVGGSEGSSRGATNEPLPSLPERQPKKDKGTSKRKNHTTTDTSSSRNETSSSPPEKKTSNKRTKSGTATGTMTLDSIFDALTVPKKRC